MAELHRDLLAEAYLEPIRFALLVDDEFPTYGQPVDANARVRTMVDLCRARGWLCDVESNVHKIIDIENNKHLHQSDLLIVDFHLESARPEDCTAAIQLLQKLAISPHFNLVLIYTSDEPTSVALSVAYGLGSGEFISADLEEQLSDKLDEGIEGIELPPDIKLIKAMVGSRGYEGTLADAQKAYGKVLNKLGKPMLSMVAKRHFENRMRAEAIASRPTDVSPSCDVDSDVPWISTPNLFVAVVSKDELPEVLIERLCDGLAASRPTPLQAMVVQARAALEKAGSKHDRSVLRQSLTQAGWFLNLLSAAPGERAGRMNELYSHLFSSLAAEMQAAAGAFGNKIIGDVAPADALSAARDLSRLGEEVGNEAVYHAANEFLCSGPLETDGRLAPGLVFKASLGRGAEQFWVCTTPSCDLVPGQNEGGWDGQLGEFKAVYAARLARLPARDLEERLRQATNGRHIYLTVDGKPTAFEVADETKRQAKLEVLFVNDQGRYASGKFQGMLIRQEGGKPTFKEVGFEVIAKLRPGYAAKFLMDAGVQKARIGLNWLRMPGTDSTASAAAAVEQAVDLIPQAQPLPTVDQV
ncbi:response regulator receiver domain [Antarcticirhabdus aurantiaca]|uniref:Response regulator receiver domain n=1 Tax=Antarcticirhabdus aurantiaca TaxID=2606717 RepID=A0ACD4NP96_9HYPH|nr:response regulator receiver domain [Antarcticirhabdus aurantiaca]WAJ28505.1 response regulator receiver domain [Jeongeuplla avenae]